MKLSSTENSTFSIPISWVSAIILLRLKEILVFWQQPSFTLPFPWILSTDAFCSFTITNIPYLHMFTVNCPFQTGCSFLPSPHWEVLENRFFRCPVSISGFRGLFGLVSIKVFYHIAMIFPLFQIAFTPDRFILLAYWPTKNLFSNKLIFILNIELRDLEFFTGLPGISVTVSEHTCSFFMTGKEYP